MHTRATSIFVQADRDESGWLSKKELKRAIQGNDDIRFDLRTAGGRPWKDFWAELDVDGDGRIELDELINYVTKVLVDKTDSTVRSVKDLAREIFERADRDGNGVLSKRELKRVLHEDDDLRDELRAAHGRHWKDFWTELDANGDGQIEFEELVEYIDKAHKQHVDNAVASAAEARSNPAAAEEKADKGTDETSTGGESTARTDETFGERLARMRAHVRDIFERADRDKNGWLSKKELKRVLHEDDDLRYELRTSGGRPWKEFWAELDVDNDGRIEEKELVDYLMKVLTEKASKHHASLKERAKDIFERADRDKNGWLSKKELKRVLHEDDDLRDELRTAHGRHWKDFWTELDANGDGKITLDELVDYIEKAGTRHVQEGLELVRA
ncbi:hypothetical protein, variant [Salpingoeca rosetta]|nr:hypothetical protein, variant [Salpingoeca rosetta]EGD81550.1 hypothetical protein, variant [Salpingoeca rosetta]|eukprot:XP_004996754.1 hypothetical protein, variant [Salpingoeca rosetta]